MRLISLLVFAALFAPFALSAETELPSGVPVNTVPLTTPNNDFAGQAQLFELLAPQEAAAPAFDSRADICYRIRAYIFRRDDDRAPELVGSTTCGPAAPHRKDVEHPKARFVPAK